jgi:hypothetical protein
LPITTTAERKKPMTIEPKGEDLRKATRWISDERLNNPEASLSNLIEQACVKFDLPPKDAEFLTRFFAQKDQT